MNLSTALAEDLAQLTNALDSGARRRGDLSRSLRCLRDGVGRVVGSFVGLSVTVTTDGQDLTLTLLHDPVEPGDIRSWLRLPLGSISADLTGSVTLYANRAGAFVHLAQDLRAAVHPTGGLAMGEELPPGVAVEMLVSGITGAEEMSAVNHALGLLLGRGLTPERARALLLDQAALEAVPVAVVAERFLHRQPRR